MDSGIFMTDCGLVNPPRVQGHNWFLGDTPLTPLPKPWPSAEARERNIDLRGITHAARSRAAMGPSFARPSPAGGTSSTATRSPAAAARSSSYPCSSTAAAPRPAASSPSRSDARRGVQPGAAAAPQGILLRGRGVTSGAVGTHARIVSGGANPGASCQIHAIRTAAPQGSQHGSGRRSPRRRGPGHGAATSNAPATAAGRTISGFF